VTHPTKDEVKQMIDSAIDHHNKTATVISCCIGFSLLGFYADGVLRVASLIPAS